MMDRLLEKDVVLRVLSVFIALMLWFLAANERNPMTSAEVRGVAVKVQSVAAGCAAAGDLRSVDITVRGRRDIVQHVSRADFAATLDLGGLAPGEHVVPVSVVSPIGVEVESVTPQQVAVFIDSVVRRQVAVTVVCLGRPARDYRVTSASVTPTDVVVEGPARLVQEAALARARVDVAGATSDVARTVPLQVVDEDGQELKGLTCAPSTVEATVTVGAMPPAHVLRVTPVIVGQPQAGYRLAGVTVDPAEVEAWGPTQVLAALDEIEAGPLSIAGAKADVSLRLTLELPEGISAIEPGEVVIAARIEREEERRLEGVAVRVLNVAEGLALAAPATVDVVVTGPRSLVEALKLEDVVATVDLAGLGAGEHQLVVRLETPAGIDARGDPPRVTVRLISANGE